MSRTDELRRNGAHERGGGGGGTPFVKWPERYAWIEGSVVDLWDGKYGESATLFVTGASEGLEVGGKSEEGEKYVRPATRGSEVNVGLNYAALKGAITKDDKGKHFHVAFEGWAESKNGDKYRVFAVLEVPKNGNGADESTPPAAPDDDLPF